MTAMPEGWQFLDDEGTFLLPSPQEASYLYFPLVNQAGMMSCVTPTFNGDAKIGQNAFLLLPVSVEDLHTSRAGRNFWVWVDGRAWSAMGNSAAQLAQRFSPSEEQVTLRAGLLWQTVERRNTALPLRAEVTAFVPCSEDWVELLRIVLTNESDHPIALTPTAAVPIFGRSADNLRDHRHVTSLLHRTTCHRHGILVRPTLSFDERGHLVNRLRYAVLGAEGDGQPPQGFFPAVEDFIGEGGTFDWPRAVVNNLPPTHQEGAALDGYETVGALRFAERVLAPGESAAYILILAVLPEEQEVETLLARYASAERFADWFEQTRSFWQQKLSALRFETGDERYNGWLRWVTLQPILRRWMGNSFLPYHDYGRGGRGWRDLWQDALALLLTEGEDVADMLWQNFAGVRMDGSNATIIGTRPGEFKADRNNIPRVWMDHGAWPLLTVRLYLDLSGDLDFLLREQVYFQDHLTHRCRRVNPRWSPEQGTGLRAGDGSLIQGTVLEHLLVQHLTAFYHVGEHNVILLEGADWNDALDMAPNRGESVAFTALYAANLRLLSELCQALAERGVTETPLAEELIPLLEPLDYASVEAKRQRLQEYFDRIAQAVSGRKQTVPLNVLAERLREKADWMIQHLRRQEWLVNRQGFSRFNGYYDDDGQRVEGDFPAGTRMTLTGQVFTLMSGVADEEQVRQIVRSVDHYLYDESVGGYRLNTDFGELKTNLGRAFGFAFGHKENGAMFSHMAVMYAYALYRRGRAEEGWRVLAGIYRQSQDFERSRMYPGIPEYFNSRGRGMYPYLTGSAAWYLFTLLTEVYGVKGRLGDLRLAPRFVAGQFARTETLTVEMSFAGKLLEVRYVNPRRLGWGEYRIVAVEVNGQPYPLAEPSDEVVFARQEVAGWPARTCLVVHLAA